MRKFDKDRIWYAAVESSQDTGINNKVPSLEDLGSNLAVAFPKTWNRILTGFGMCRLRNSCDFAMGVEMRPDVVVVVRNYLIEFEAASAI